MADQGWIIITGAGTGIGMAMAHHFAGKGWQVLGVGRRPQPLEEMRAHYPEIIHILSADVASQDGRAAINAALPEDSKISYLIHNAGVLQPVKPLIEITPDEFRHHMSINLEGPLFLTQALAHRLEIGSRVLHISSGAAHGAYSGWGAYCTSKAALNMVYRMLDLELNHRGVRVGSVRPGVVDTPMQDQVRSASEDVFPDLQRFIDLKQNNQLLPPARVAFFMEWLLTQTEDEEFAGEEWDIRDASHQHRWQGDQHA